MSGRIRTVKPEWLEDELLALASSDARVLSIALILLADDYGNGRGNPVQLAGQVFPGKPIETLANALEELRRIKFVTLYEVGGQKYFSIRKWKDHQKVDKPGKNRVPSPPADSAEIDAVSAATPNPLETLEKVIEDGANLLASRGSDRVGVAVQVGGFGTGPDPARDLAARADRMLRDRCGTELELPAFQTWPEVKAICDAFAETYGRRDDVRHGGDPRARAMLGRFSEGYPVETLVLAVRNSRHADYMAEKQSNQALVTILRDAAQVDKFAALTGEQGGRRPKGAQAPRQPDSGYSPIDNAREVT